ncbi:MAG: magnesium/cobalt transporter CorA [Ignavibacteria bacterium]|nr:magnesium/cobalt transporter CorA [Ignavibacteria bacterium]
MLNILYYDGLTLKEIQTDELVQVVKSEFGANTMVWIDIADPTPEEEKLVFEDCLPIHTLALSDIRRGLNKTDNEEIHHPKVEEFEFYLLVIAHAMELRKAAASDESGHKGLHILTTQLSAVVNSNVLVTHHSHSLQSISQTTASCTKNPQVMRKGPDFVLHLVLDFVVDNYIEISNHYEQKVESLEGVVLNQPSTKTLMRLLHLRRSLQKFLRTIHYLREIVYRLSRGEFPMVSIVESVYYRNVYDHLVRVSDQVETVKELVSGLVEVYFSVTSSRLNNVMKVLTVISTVFLPITFITSFYGMNFQHMPELRLQWAYPAVIVVIVLIAVLMIVSFKRRGWLD